MTNDQIPMTLDDEIGEPASVCFGHWVIGIWSFLHCSQALLANSAD
jgi:hypothetical protein